MNIDELQAKVDEAWRETCVALDEKNRALAKYEQAAGAWSSLTDQLHREQLKAQLRAEIEAEKGTTI